MPRYRPLGWDTKVAIFLDYRRLGKVYPVAKNHGVARSTVAGIVEEFVGYGFSRKPRLDLPADLLARVQERHLQDVREGLRQTPSIDFKTPGRHLPTAQPPGEGGSGLVLRFPTSVVPGEDLLWHLRGTEGDAILEHASQALLQFDLQCQELWNDLRGDIERVCNSDKEGGTIRVVPYRPQAEVVAVKGPFIPHELVNLVYQHLLGTGRQEPIRPELWRPSSGDPAVLMAGTLAAAVGEEIHETVRMGIASFLGEGIGRYREWARDLEGFYHDLRYLSDLVRQVLSSATEEQVPRGICPACPYPEAVRDLFAGSRQGTRQGSG